MSDIRKRLERVEQSQQARHGRGMIVEVNGQATLNGAEKFNKVDEALQVARAKFAEVIVIHLGATSWTPE